MHAGRSDATVALFHEKYDNKTVHAITAVDDGIGIARSRGDLLKASCNPEELPSVGKLVKNALKYAFDERHPALTTRHYNGGGFLDRGHGFYMMNAAAKYGRVMIASSETVIIKDGENEAEIVHLRLPSPVRGVLLV